MVGSIADQCVRLVMVILDPGKASIILVVLHNGSLVGSAYPLI